MGWPGHSGGEGVNLEWEGRPRSIDDTPADSRGSGFRRVLRSVQVRVFGGATGKAPAPAGTQSMEQMEERHCLTTSGKRQEVLLSEDPQFGGTR